MGGSGDAPDADSLNLLFEVAPDAEVFQELRLPDSVNALQRNHGFEGVAAAGGGNTERIYVAFQREWQGDSDGHVRLGRYDASTDEWTFFYHPLDAPTSSNGGWVRLSEIAAVKAPTFYLGPMIGSIVTS